MFNILLKIRNNKYLDKEPTKIFSVASTITREANKRKNILKICCIEMKINRSKHNI